MSYKNFRKTYWSFTNLFIETINNLEKWLTIINVDKFDIIPLNRRDKTIIKSSHTIAEAK